MRGCTRAKTSSPHFYTPLFLILILITQTTAASYAQFGGQPNLPSLFPRQNVCSDSVASTSCGINNFCCPADTRCIPVEKNSSVVCCKIGEFCDEIFPIACTSTVLATDSVQCGKQCCPVGYDCGGTKDRCILKPENLPPDHIANRDSKKTQSDEVMREQCRAFLAASSDGGEVQKKCTKFSFEGILTGLFPGIVVGVAIMFAYTKTVEMKSRRRTIRFNGRLSASPDDLSYIDQKLPPVPVIQGDIAIGYSPTAERAMTPTSFQRGWEANTLADYSPNLGPVIAPRGRSVSRDRRASERLSPLPRPLPTSPLKPRPVHNLSHRSSTDSEDSDASLADTSFSGISLAISSTPRAGASDYHRHLDAASYTSDGDDDDDEDGFSEVVIIDGTGEHHHHGLSHREQEQGNGRRRLSTATGYTASLYLDPESSRSYARESGMLPLNFKGDGRF